MKSITEKIRYNYYILCIGSGGTGTYFLKEFSHFIGTASKKVQAKIKSLYIADGDTIEEKNLSRQCFSSEDIGDNKASAFCMALNDMLEGYPNCNLQWSPLTEYITSVDRLKEIFSSCYTNPKEVTATHYKDGIPYQTLAFNIPIIISCVDNNGARAVFEKFYEQAPNCFLYDAGNEYSEGQVCFAHRLLDKFISPPTSFYFPNILTGDLRQVTELSCTELNASAPQHLATNMNAGLHLLLGMIALLEEQNDAEKDNILSRIQSHLGFVFFDTFTHSANFVPFNNNKKEVVAL